jgi:hypothetical protein
MSGRRGARARGGLLLVSRDDGGLGTAASWSLGEGEAIGGVARWAWRNGSEGLFWTHNWTSICERFIAERRSRRPAELRVALLF